MGRYTDGDATRIAAEARPVVEELSADDKELARELTGYLDMLDSTPAIDHIPPGRSKATDRWRSERDTALATLEAVLEQHEEFDAGLPKEHGPIKIRKLIGNADRFGDHYVETVFADGHVERVMQDRDAFDAAVATMKHRVDERQEIRDLNFEVSQFSDLIARTTDPVAADQLRERRDALAKEARERRDRLTNAVVGDARARGLSEADIAAEAKGLDLTYAPLADGVRETLEAAKAGDIDGVYAAVDGMAPNAKQQLWERLDEGTREQLLERESGARDEAARIARVGGLS